MRLAPRTRLGTEIRMEVGREIVRGSSAPHVHGEVPSEKLAVLIVRIGQRVLTDDLVEPGHGEPRRRSRCSSSRRTRRSMSSSPFSRASTWLRRA